jgi:hypothetical protein
LLGLQILCLSLNNILFEFYWAVFKGFRRELYKLRKVFHFMSSIQNPSIYRSFKMDISYDNGVDKRSFALYFAWWPVLEPFTLIEKDYH